MYATHVGMLGEYLGLGPIDRPLASAFGRVALWGTVLECERGWRASAAYPQDIYLPAERLLIPHRDTPEAIAFDLAEYRVPIELVESDPSRVLRELGRLAA